MVVSDPDCKPVAAKTHTSKRREAAPHKSTRRRSREFALQGLYQWQLARTDPVMIATELSEAEEFAKSDVQYFRTLLNGAIDHAEELQQKIAPLLDRGFAELSPVERGILLLSGYELMHELEVPYRVVINEAVELAKVYGGTDGHKFVNGVLDKLAAQLRDIEVTAERGA
jgi:transcription antitermination protein NusB